MLQEAEPAAQLVERLAAREGVVAEREAVAHSDQLC